MESLLVEKYFHINAVVLPMIQSPILMLKITTKLVGHALAVELLRSGFVDLLLRRSQVVGGIERFLTV